MYKHAIKNWNIYYYIYTYAADVTLYNLYCSAPEAAVGPRLIKYDRDFLLQFRYKPVCLEKPASLPDHEIVLSAPNMPGEETGSLR